MRKIDVLLSLDIDLINKLDKLAEAESKTFEEFVIGTLSSLCDTNKKRKPRHDGLSGTEIVEKYRNIGMENKNAK